MVHITLHRLVDNKVKTIFNNMTIEAARIIAARLNALNALTAKMQEKPVEIEFRVEYDVN